MDYTKRKQPFLVYLEGELDEYRKIFNVHLEQGRRFLLKEIRFNLKPYIQDVAFEIFSTAAPSRQLEPINTEIICGGPAITADLERLWNGIPLNYQFPEGDSIQIHITGQGMFDLNPPVKMRLLLIGEYIPEGVKN